MVKDILSGKKTKTWRMFDEKDLSTGDEIEFVSQETEEFITFAKITDVKVKKFGDIEGADFDGHNPYPSREAMLETYRGYYGDKVDWNTQIKMLTFELEKQNTTENNETV